MTLEKLLHRIALEIFSHFRTASATLISKVLQFENTQLDFFLEFQILLCLNSDIVNTKTEKYPSLTLHCEGTQDVYNISKKQNRKTFF